ncbi:MAG TPA: xanthine dehydrogenase family protein molybdopterin-binding subunit [Stellaceae bacterium]|nr:xanthine dehydrogenase family protein molybdopterin-binding subunit [Stellaceae bacterium]
MTLDAPPGLPIGRPMPRPATRRLVEGRGRYVDDFVLPRMLHAAFLRSPYARAAIERLDTAEAARMPGVARIFTGNELAQVCRGWRGNSAAYPGMNSPVQRPLAIGRANFQGEPVALVLADSRAQAEDAAEKIAVEWCPEPATSSLEAAAGEPPAHPELASNLGWRHEIQTPGFAPAFAGAATIVEDCLVFGRHTGVPLEPRGLVAEYDAGDEVLTLHHSHQVPHQMQQHFADLLGLGEHRVRVQCPDVGGGFGIKLHLYPDEIAIAAAALLVRRPIKWIADRLESMMSDIHARENAVAARMALDAEGRLIGFEFRDVCGMGAYSIYPRASPGEALGAVRTLGAPYSFRHFRAAVEAVFQNRPPTAMYRAVGFPIGTTTTERLVDRAARALGEDPAALRRRLYMRPEEMPCTSPNGTRLFELSHEACLDRLLQLMDYEALKAERERLRGQHVFRGIGLAAFVELTAAGVEVYGAAERPVIAMDSVALKIEPSGGVRVLASVTEQGQGTSAAIAQIVAAALGVGVEAVHVATGDTAFVPAGGGAWASRGVAIGGEAAWEAGRRLKDQVLRMAGRLLQVEAQALDLVGGAVVERDSGAARMPLKELAELAYMRGHLLPPDAPLELAVSHQYRRTAEAWIPTNGIQASYLELDPETGLVRLLKHWCVEDCGRVVNPLLLDEQIRGGVVQGIGGALFEACRYDEEGQLLSGTLADYLVPMTGEMPDIVIGHVETPFSGTALGAKGAGESGTCAAAAALLNAVNDALAPLGAEVCELPMTPAAILAALEKARAAK